MIVPNKNYVLFEEWLMPILDKMLDEQVATGTPWTPSTMIRRLGLEINNKESIYYWCAVNDIPVFSPALTDGSIGDMLFFHSYTAKHTSAIILDIVEDIRSLNMKAMKAKHTGAIIIGGGVVKHHIVSCRFHAQYCQRNANPTFQQSQHSL